MIPPDCCVLIVRLEEALVAPGTTDDGEKEHVVPAGRFAQLSATVLPKLPPSAETVIVVCPVLPVLTVRAAGDAETA